MSTNTWQMQQVSGAVQPLVPANTYQPIGGDAPYALWVERQADGSGTLMRGVAASGARGVSATALMRGLPPQALGSTTIAVQAGDWALLVWEAGNEVDVFYNRLFARLVGPGSDSGVIELTNHFEGAAWDVRAALDVNGRHLLVWDEPGHRGAQGRLVNQALVREPDVGESVASVQRLLVGPDGQGWLLQGVIRNDEPVQEVRRFTAAEGVGSPMRLDDPAAGPLFVPLVASAEGPTTFTAVSMQQHANDTHVCLAVRRMVAGRLQSPTCVNTSGNSLPNRNWLSLASHPNGAAVLVWSVGDERRDLGLYASRRATASGEWSAPALLTTLPSDPLFSLLCGLKTGMSADGQPLVVYCASDSLLARRTTRAMTQLASGVWMGPTEWGLPGMQTNEMRFAFNGQGVPGIMQTLTDGRVAAVMMSTWRAQGWQSTTLRYGIQQPFSSLGYVKPSLSLVPQGSGGWLAAWKEGQGPAQPDLGETYWLSEFR